LDINIVLLDEPEDENHEKLNLHYDFVYEFGIKVCADGEVTFAYEFGIRVYAKVKNKYN